MILKERNLKVAQEVEEWPRALRRASINSFGYGGANGHVILECPKSYLGHDFQMSSIEDSETQDGGKLLVLPVSASSPKSLESLVESISQTITQIRDEKTLQSLAHTLIKGRDQLRQRSFLLARFEDSGAKLIQETADGPVTKASSEALPFGFVFTGQGAQYAGMAKELLLKNEHFRNTIRRLDSVLQALPSEHVPDWTLEQTILDDGPDSRINEVTRSQPICTAVQVGVVDLLRSWNVQPTYVVGHSSGEIAAAYAAGLLTSSQAILAAYFRGFAVGELTSKGAMMAAGLDPEAAKALIESKGLEGQVRVACVNSPESVTLSGTPDGIETLRSDLQSENKFARKLETGGRAYHSHMMEEIGQRYEDLLAPYFAGDDGGPTPEGGDATMYSSVGHSSDGLGVVDNKTYFPKYWRDNLEQPVQFSGALANLIKAGNKSVHLVEIGPHAALKGPIKQIRTGLKLKEEAVPYSPSLVRGKDTEFCIKALAGTLFTFGHLALNWDAVNSLPESGLRVLHDLAPYPWDYSRGLLWSEPRASAEMRGRKHKRHELLGTQALTGNGIDYTWRNLLRLSETPWLKDHKVENQIVFPATGYMAIAIEAVSQITGAKEKPADQLAFEFRNVNISAALNIPEEERDVYSTAKDLELHTTMSARKISNANSSVDWHDFSVSSWLAGRTTVHCTGSIRVTEARKTAGGGVALQNTASFDVWPTSRWYKKWHEEGLCFGPTFQSLTSLKTDAGRGRREAIGVTHIEPPVARESTTYYPVHPITIDAALQAAILSTTAGHLPSLKTWLPVFIAECRIQPPQGGLVADANGEVGSPANAEGEIHSRSEETGLSSRRIDGTLRDSRGVPVIDFKGGKISLYTGKTSSADVDSADASTNPASKFMKREPTLRIRWKPDVLRLRPEAESRLKEYVAEFVDQQPDDVRDDETMAIIGTLLDLAGHKNPRMRVLELEGDAFGYKAKQWQAMLDKDTSFSRCRSWNTGTMTDGDISVEGDGLEGPFDVLLVPTVSPSPELALELYT